MKYMVIGAFLFNIAYGLSFSEMKLKLKDKVEPLLGTSISDLIFGESVGRVDSEVKLPKIPLLQNSSLDQSIYKKREIDQKLTGFSLLTKDQKQNYQVIFLDELYQNILNRKISDDKLSIYLNRFSQGVTREGIYRALVSGDEYFELEKSPTIPSLELVNFINTISIKFFGFKFNQGVLANSNRHTIKKNIIDKALDFCDFFANNPEDLYSWYAVLSSDLAKQSIWINKVRKNHSQAFHYNWSKRASLDHIKSEIIIKLAKSINSY